MFLKRLISSVSILSFVGLVIFVFPNWFFLLVAIFIGSVALYEFFTMIEKRHAPLFKYFGILIGIIIPLSIYREFQLTEGWELFFIVAICFIIFILQLARKATDQAVISVSTTLFGILYISWLFSFIIKLKFLDNGAGLVAFLVLVTKCGDMGAYTFGSLLGRHTLIRRISPKKTWEGAIGGFLTSVFIAYASRGLVREISNLHAVILGMLLGIAAVVGDLYESLLKRDCDVKDAGSLFPGLGGMLDIIDSILFTAPIFYFYVKFMVLQI